MRILLAHNYYQRRGGEDAVFENEAKLLEDRGHTVIRHAASNNSIETIVDKASAFAKVTWNAGAARTIGDLVARTQPDILHVHNFFPLFSPSIYDAARKQGVAVVQTLHNYRLGCASGFLTRQGVPCELCIGRLPLPAIQNRCYRDSLVGSIAVAGMITAHKWRGTWQSHVDRFIALTDYAREKISAIGVPLDRISVKPNFVPDPGYHEHGERSGAVFVGRLAPEKGIQGLVSLWTDMPESLTIAGAGPLAEALKVAAAPNVTFLGHLGADDLMAAYRRARFIVLPSTGVESMPITLLEAWATGMPAIAFKHSAFAELIEDGVTGLLVPSGDFGALGSAIAWAFANPESVAAMGRAARAHYAQRFTPDANYEQLLNVYRAARETLTSPRVAPRSKADLAKQS